MPYDNFDSSLPTSAQNGTAMPDAVRKNLNALRDAFLAGVMPGWSAVPTVGTGTSFRPQYWTLSKGIERIKATTTWGTSGGAKDNPVTVVLEYSGNSGTSWDTMGTVSFTYNADGSCSGITGS